MWDCVSAGYGHEIPRTKHQKTNKDKIQGTTIEVGAKFIRLGWQGPDEEKSF